MIVFITGGAKNGKSSFAQSLAVKLAAGGRRYYIATMIPVDDEDRERIRRHIADREGLGFETVEQGRNILECLKTCDPGASFLLDSTTALLMNELFLPPDWHLDEQAGARCAEEVARFAQSVKNIVLVSDYIYSDALRYGELTEEYRRGLAYIDRCLAAACDTVAEVSFGGRLIYKGEIPV